MILFACLALIPRFLLGFLLVDFIWRPRRTTDLVIKAFLALPMGVGVSSLFSFIWIWAGLDLRIYAWLETFLIIVISIFIVWRNRDNVRSFLGSVKVFPANTEYFLLATVVIIFISLVWIYSTQYPHGAWDAWSNWNVTTRFVYRGGENWRGTFLRTGHPDYPFLLTMTNTTTWELLNKETTRGPIALAFFFLLSLAGLLFGLINALRGPKQASIAAILLITQPIIIYHGMTLYADLPEAFYFLASAGLMSLFLSSGDKSIAILAGLMTGLGAWTKNEGLTFVAINLIAWMGIGLFLKEKLVVKNFLLGLSFPLLVVILFKIFLAPGNDLMAENQSLIKQALDTQRYIKILSFAGKTLWEFGEQPVSIAGVFIAYMVLAGKTKNSIKGMFPVVFAILAQLMVYFLIFVITPYDLEWHLSTSLSRLYLHLFPLALMCLLLWVKTPDELKLQMEDKHAPHH